MIDVATAKVSIVTLVETLTSVSLNGIEYPIQFVNDIPEPGDTFTLWKSGSVFKVYFLSTKHVNSRKGPKGFMGPVGERGDKGPKGYTGMDGDKGPTGETGPDGDRGRIGKRGRKAIVIEGATNNENIITGPVGKQGITGKQGFKGKQGPSGINGKAGSIGESGEIGEAGDKGEVGITGKTGIKGKQGPKGLKGYKNSLTNHVNTNTSLDVHYFVFIHSSVTVDMPVNPPENLHILFIIDKDITLSISENIDSNKFKNEDNHSTITDCDNIELVYKKGAWIVKE